MAAFGTLTLLIAMVVATYGAVASIVGARRRNQRLADNLRGSPLPVGILQAAN